MSTYTLLYDGEYLATVTIDDAPTTRQAIEEMVTFWAFWEKRLAEAKGDYTRCWLKQLARYILNHRAVPDDSEGWYPLDGSRGIKVADIISWYPDEELIEVMEGPI